MLQLFVFRVQRIAAALPDVGVKVASEEVNRQLKTLVVTSPPQKDQFGSWKLKTAVVDKQTSEAWVLNVALQSENDKNPYDTLLGCVMRSDPNAGSFQIYQGYAQKTKTSTSVPTFIDEASSFALPNTDAGDVVERLVSWMTGGKDKTTSVKIDGSNWQSVSKDLPALKDTLKGP